MINRALVMLLLLLGLKDAISHGNHTAEFNYKFNSTSIFLEFQIEKDLLEHFDLKDNCESYEKTIALCLFEYIDSTNRITINKDLLNFEILESSTDEHYFYIELICEGDFSNLKEILIINTCFFEFDDSFANRIRIDTGDSKKSYLLDKENTEIKIKLD